MDRRLMLFAWLVLSVVLPRYADAQNSCPGLTVRNDSSQPVDQQVLCSAARPWIDRGEQVFVFATDVRPPTEDAWFAVRDDVESRWQIYDPATKLFSKTALAVEVTTDTSAPWGHDIAFGESLSGTPLDDDAAIQRLEGRLKNQVAAGDLDAAIADALSGAFAVAFPNAQSNGSAGTAPSATGQASGGPSFFRRVLAPMAGIGAFLAGAVFFIPRVLLPALRRRRRLEALRQHLAELRRKVNGLLYAARTLFTGETVEETTLWKLFLIYRGDQYPDLAADVRGWVDRATGALNESLLLSQELGEREPGKGEEAVTEMVRAYEMLYLTLVGTNPQILAMSEDAFRSFIDPMAEGLQNTVDGGAVVSQVRELRQELGQQPLRIDLQIVDPKEVDADGIFGYANRIKEVLARLDQAQQQAPIALATAHRTREQVSSGTALPEGLDQARALAAVDQRLSRADDEARAERWLAVADEAAAAMGLLEQLRTFFPLVVAAVEQHRQRERQVDAIAQAGYRLGFLPAAQRAWSELRDSLYDQIQVGDVEAARGTLQNLEVQSSALLTSAQALVALREHNEAELRRLAAEVARVEQLRVGEAASAWSVLRAYPQGNWQNVADHFDAATLTLRQLFDDPANSHDLASSIAHQNSMEQQAFETASHGLHEAFVRLAEAEGQLRALIARLQEVREIESNGTLALDATRADLVRAVARRDRDDEKIDADVDRQLELAADAWQQAQEKLGEREFIAAGDFIKSARTLATQAYNSADQQAQAIDSAYKQLKANQTQAGLTVNTSIQELGQLPPAALGATTAALCRSAEEALRQAGLEEAKLHGLQDRALAAGLDQAIGRYQEAEQAAQQALAQIRADRAAYEGLVTSAGQALRTAQQAIDAARHYTSQTDAGGAGRSTLSQAERTLPSLPRHGASLDLLRRTVAEAERSRELADVAAGEAQTRINEVRAAREAERRRREEAERRRRDEEAAERRRRDATARAVSSVSRTSSSSSSRSSSLGSSSSSRSSSMGSSRRR